MTPVTEHRFIVLCDFSCARADSRARMLALTMGETDAPPKLLHPDRRADVKAMAASLFAESKFVIGDDLHPAVAAQFADGAGEWCAGRRVPAIALSQQGLDLLNGDRALPLGDPRRVKGYSGQRGISLNVGLPGQPENGVLWILSMQVLHFASGTGLALVTLEWKGAQPLTLEKLQLLLSRLTPNRQKDVLSWAQFADPAQDQRFSLSWLLGQVLVPAACSFEVWSRFFTVVYAALPAGTDANALSNAAWRLSRQYSEGYTAEPGWPGTELYAPFTDIRHALSLEGAATVATGDSDFVTNGGLLGRFDTCYVPLAALAYHEHAYLLDIAQEAACIPPGNDAAAQAQALRRLTDRFLRFRLRYRLPLASDITMHNAFYEKARRALQLEALENKLGQDVVDAQAHLRRLSEDAAAAAATATAAAAAKAAHDRDEAYRQRERQLAPILGLFAGMLTFLTTSAVFKDVKASLGWPSSFVAFGLALGFGLLAAIVTWYRHRRENRPGVADHGHHGGHTAHHLDEERRHEAGLTATKMIAAASIGSAAQPGA